MKGELIRFNTSDNLGLEGFLCEPTSKAETVVIHVHGGMSNFYENRCVDAFASVFNNAGIAFFTFNNRGAEIIRYRWRSKTMSGLVMEKFEESVFDIDAAIEFVKACGYKKIVLQGHSLGANKVTYYVTTKKFDGRVVLLAPTDIVWNAEFRANSLLKMFKLPIMPFGNIGKTFAEGEVSDIFRYRNGHIIEELGKVKNSIIVVIGKQDECYENQDKQEYIDYIKSAFAGAKLVAEVIDGDHLFTGQELKVADIVKGWLING